ncbi:MAG: hypothetical protein RIS76_142 [Verrucomicrobiota bacterium]|jgi:putative toxin-antitoxin system antitoxin component (TIGR02293 family)
MNRAQKAVIYPPAGVGHGVVLQEALPTVAKQGAGVVRSCIRASLERGAPAGLAASQIIDALRLGLPVRELDDLQAALQVPMEKLGPMLGISKATLHRRKAEGRLGIAESDRIVRFARLMGRAIEVLESPENARRWLNAPQVGLGDAVPLVYAETEVGAREVEDLLGRIEYGVYS